MSKLKIGTIKEYREEMSWCAADTLYVMIIVLVVIWTAHTCYLAWPV